MTAGSTPIAALGDRSLFSQLDCKAYVNHAGISPPSDPVRAAVQAAMTLIAERGSDGLGVLLTQREALRELLATLLGATAAEIALVPNTMYGLASIALSIPWRSGDRVIVFQGEYPTNVTVFQRAAALFGVEVVALSVADFALPGGPDYSRLLDTLRQGRVRLCAVSAVQFQTGLRMPLAEMARLCHAHGAELVVDAIQALGAVPLDVAELDIDYLAAGSQKWLMGIDGAGVLYVKRERLGALRPAIVGAMSHPATLDMLMNGPGHLRYDHALRDDARVFEGGMLSSAACAALHTSLSCLIRLGVPAIYAHVNAYLDVIEPALTQLGFVSQRTTDDARRSCTLSLRPPGPHTAPALARRLTALGVIASCPDGFLRVSPHWHNAISEVVPMISCVEQALR